MATVEEAEIVLIHAVHSYPDRLVFGVEITAFKEACLAQGRAEGAEQMMEKIRKSKLSDVAYLELLASVLAPEVK